MLTSPEFSRCKTGVLLEELVEIGLLGKTNTIGHILEGPIRLAQQDLTGFQQTVTDVRTYILPPVLFQQRIQVIGMKGKTGRNLFGRFYTNRRSIVDMSGFLFQQLEKLVYMFELIRNTVRLREMSYPGAGYHQQFQVSLHRINPELVTR